MIPILLHLPAGLLLKGGSGGEEEEEEREQSHWVSEEVVYRERGEGGGCSRSEGRGQGAVFYTMDLPLELPNTGPSSKHKSYSL